MAIRTPIKIRNCQVVLDSRDIHFTIYSVDQDKPVGTLFRPTRHEPTWRTYNLRGTLVTSRATAYGAVTMFELNQRTGNIVL